MRKALMHIEQGLSGAVEIPHLLVVVDQIALNEIAVVGSCFGLGVDLPQQNRGDDSGADHHQDDRYQKGIMHQSAGNAFVGDDQRDLAAGDHADADPDRLILGIAAELGAEAAADDFGED